MSLSHLHRRPRFPFHTQGTLRVGLSSYPGTLIDISLNGALFSHESLTDVESGIACTLTVYYVGKSPFLTVEGQLCCLRDRCACIRFAQTSQMLEHVLRRLVDLNLGLPGLLDRDISALLRLLQSPTQGRCLQE